MFYKTISTSVSSNLQKASSTREMFVKGHKLKQQYGDRVCDLSLGNPFDEPPDKLHQVVIDLYKKADRSFHRYMQNEGFEDVRKTIADAYSKRLKYDVPWRRVIMTSGAAGAINILLRTILNPDDEVVLFAPYFSEYHFYISNFGGKPVICETDTTFELDLDNLESALTDSTRAVILNSPNNPTGKIYSESRLRDLADLLEEKSKKFGRPVYLLSDEPYREIVYEGEVPDVLSLYPYSIVAHSYSKCLSIPGERMGEIVVSPRMEDNEAEELLSGINFCIRAIGYVNAPATMQKVVAELQDERPNVESYRARRDTLFEALKSFGYRFEEVPAGAFYLFPRSPIENDDEFIEILNKHLVLCVPGGRGFLRKGYFRIAYCVPMETIKNSFEGFRKAIEECT